MIFSGVRDLLQHHKVILIPVEYGGEWRTAQVGRCDFSGAYHESEIFCSFRDCLHGYTLFCGMTQVGKSRQALIVPVMPTYHCQTGKTALHGVVLRYKRKSGKHFIRNNLMDR